MAAVPGYWMHEESGVLEPVVRRYLEGLRLDDVGLVIMRAYLRQWVNADGFVGPRVDELRGSLDGVTSMGALDAWLERATDAGIDPF